MTLTPTPMIFGNSILTKHTFCWGLARYPFWWSWKPTFCSAPRFEDPYTNPPPIFRKRCQDGPNRRSRKTLRFVALFCLIIPKMPIFGDPENPTSCRTPRFDDPSNPYDFRKQCCDKVHIFLGFCTMPIIGDPENPTFCSTPRFDDSYTPYDFPKMVF